MFSTLRINTVTGKTVKEQHDSRKFLLGGRTLSSYLASKEVPADCDPFGRKTKLFFCNGFLAGTTVSSANRRSLGAKSPFLTRGIKESNAGGVVGLRMAQQGLRCIVLEDSPTEDSQWKIVIIGKEKMDITDEEVAEAMRW